MNKNALIQAIHSSIGQIKDGGEEKGFIFRYYKESPYAEQQRFWGDLTDTVDYPTLNIHNDQLLLKVRRACPPELMECWRICYRDYTNYCDLVTSAVTQNLLETFRDILIKQAGEKQPAIKSYFQLYYNPAEQRNIAVFSRDIVHEVQRIVQWRVAEMMDRERIWDDMVKWNWEYSIPWALNIMVNKMRLDYNLEKEDSSWSQELNYVICSGNAKNNYRNQLRAYRQGVVSALTRLFDLSHKSIPEIELFLGIENPIPYTRKRLKHLPEESEFLITNTCPLYQQLRTVIGARDFGVSLEQPWPTACLSNDKGTVKGTAQLKRSPIDLLDNDQELKAGFFKQEETVHAMDDETVDVLDIIFHIWLKTVRYPEEMIIIKADDFLRMRGLVEQKGGNGRRGGYKQELRQRIACHMETLRHIWINAECQTVEVNFIGGAPRKVGYETVSGNLLEFGVFVPDAIKGISNQYIWCVRPGDMFAQTLLGPGRQTGLLSQQTIRFDPYRQNLEKRAARYFSWQWRNRQNRSNYLKPIRVRTIMARIRMDFNYSRPVRTIERFEKMLDTLQEHGLIRGWQYSDSYGKWQKWLELSVVVEPPQKVVDHYLTIQFKDKKTFQANNLERKNDKWFNAQELKKVRLDRNLTQMQVAEQLGIDQATLSRIESGRVVPGFIMLDLIKKWTG